MGFINKKTQGLIITRITDAGRKKISEGNFNIKYFQVGDSEINYTAVTSSNYNLSNLIIIEPSHNSQNNVGIPQSTKNGIKNPFYLQGISGTTYGTPIEVSSVDSVFNTASPLGFFINICNSSTTVTSNYSPYKSTLMRNTNYDCTSSQFDGTASMDLVTTSCTDKVNSQITAGDYVFVRIQNSNDSVSMCNCLASCRPMLVYRVTNVNNTTITLDRNLPNIQTLLTSNFLNKIFVSFGNFSSYNVTKPINSWANSAINFESICAPENDYTKIWNMNIVWSEDIAGTNPEALVNPTQNFLELSNKIYLGSKSYYGYLQSGQKDTSSTYYYNSFGEKINVNYDEQKAIAIVHYTNNTLINLYGEKFACEPYDSTKPNQTGQARNFKISIPWLMWHKNSSCCSGTTFYIDPPGFESLNLLKSEFIQSEVNSDMNNPGIRYFHLYDTNANSLDGGRPNRVGKVFPDDKIIIFDDEEIVAAMSYASNRNFTLPAPKVSSIQTTNSTGLLTLPTDILFVSYLMQINGKWSYLHCNYYTKVIGPQTGCTTSGQDVIVNFGGEFNCMVSSGLNGWFADKFYLIFQKITTNVTIPQSIADKPNQLRFRPKPNAWKIKDYTSQVLTNSRVDANKLKTESFLIQNADLTSSSYDLSTYLQLYNSSNVNRMKFGEEFFFYGAIETDIESTIYQMKYDINLSSNQFVKSSNPTWSEGIKPFMNEIGLFDEEKNLVVYSKLQSPQQRNGSQQVVIKLDF